MTRRLNRSNRFWRSVVGLVVAYALAFQGILIGFGAPLATNAYGHAAPGFELCLNDAQDNSGSPTKPAVPSHLDHCIFCFAGAQHALGAAPQSYAGYGSPGRGETLAPATSSDTSHRSEYSIARPRGPPVSA